MRLQKKMTKENCCIQIVKDKQAKQLNLKVTTLLNGEIETITNHIEEEVEEDALTEAEAVVVKMEEETIMEDTIMEEEKELETRHT